MFRDGSHHVSKKMLSFIRRHLFFVTFHGVDSNFLSGAANHWELPLVAISAMQLYQFPPPPSPPKAKLRRSNDGSWWVWDWILERQALEEPPMLC